MSEQACERLKGNRAETADNRQKIPRIHSKEITAADPRWRAGAADHQSGREALPWAEKQAAYAARRAEWDRGQAAVEAGRIAQHGACKP
jgi:hypothetical protein